MPEDLQEVETGGKNLVFADDAEGVRYRLNELAVYSAEEVRDDLDADDDGTPQYGRWLSVTIEDEDSWLLAPAELIDELQALEPEKGQVFEITRLEKNGMEETARWEANLKRCSNDTQTRL